MNLLRVLFACLLLAVVPLRVHAGADCCPPMDHGAHVHDAHTGHHPDGPDTGLDRLACALHCAGAALPMLDLVPASALSAPYRGTQPPAHPPLADASPHERPPRPRTA